MNCVVSEVPRKFYAFRSNCWYTLLFAHKLRFWYNLEQEKIEVRGKQSKWSHLKESLMVGVFQLLLLLLIFVLIFFLCIRFIFFQQLIKKHIENEVVFNGIRQHKS